MPLYPPTSGHSIGLSDHLINYAKEVNESILKNSKTDLVVDIGSSDGIFLNL